MFPAKPGAFAGDIILLLPVNIHVNIDVSRLFVGDVVKTHRAAAEDARRAYAVKPMPEADIVITTGYPRDADLPYGGIGSWPLRHAKPERRGLAITDRLSFTVSAGGKKKTANAMKESR